jgi:hypothetical protein
MLVVLNLLTASSIAGAEKYRYPILNINSKNLKSSVEYMTNVRPYRNYMNIGSMNSVASYIKGKFIEYGLVMEEQRFEVCGKEYANIIGTIGLENPNRVIVGAHYDVCGNQVVCDNHDVCGNPGADDNASAIAGLLEIARLTKKYASELKYRVDFIAYALEEPPFFDTEKMGSYIHAKYIYDKGIKIRAMICLEMIGFFTDEKNSQKYPLGIMKLFYPSKGNFIGIVGNCKRSPLIKEVKMHMKTTSIEVRTLRAPAWVGGVDFSDHRNYWKFGYNAVMVTDTAFYRNLNYHRDTDTIDTLNFAKMEEVVKGVCWTLLNLK